MDKATVKIGLFGIGLETYWPQFKGLKVKLVGYQDRIRGLRPNELPTNKGALNE
jgi:L-arabinose isomerase